MSRRWFLMVASAIVVLCVQVSQATLTDTVEVVSGRGPETRVWENVYEEPIPEVGGQPMEETEERRSRYIEMADGLCYDARSWAEIEAGGDPNWQPTVCDWTSTGDGNFPYEVATGPIRIRLSNDLTRWDHVRVNGDANTLNLGIVGVALQDTSSGEIFIFDTPNLVTPTVDGNRILYEDVFDCGDVEYVYERTGFKQNLIITSLDGIPSPTSIGFDPETTIIGLVSSMDLATYPHTLCQADLEIESLMAVGAAVENDLAPLTFNDAEGNGVIRLGVGEAWDRGEQTTDIRHTVRELTTRHQSQDVLVDGVDIEWLLDAQLPVTVDYIAESGGQGPTNVLFERGLTYFINGVYTVGNGETLVVEPGAVVKINGGTDNPYRCHIDVQSGGAVRALGQELDPIIFTNASNDDVGEDVSSHVDYRSGQSRAVCNFSNVSNTGDSEFQHCRIGGDAGAGFYFTFAGMGQMDFDSDNFRHCVFRNNYADFHFYDLGSDSELSLVNCLIANGSPGSSAPGWNPDAIFHLGEDIDLVINATNLTVHGRSHVFYLTAMPSETPDSIDLNVTNSLFTNNTYVFYRHSSLSSITPHGGDVSDNRRKGGSWDNDIDWVYWGGDNTELTDLPYINEDEDEDNDCPMADFFTAWVDDGDVIDGPEWDSLHNQGTASLHSELSGMTIVAPEILVELAQTSSILGGIRRVRTNLVDTGNVDIGFHHPRVDYVVASGSNRLGLASTFEHGVRVAWAPDAAIRLTVTSGSEYPQINILGTSSAPVEFFSAYAAGDFLEVPEPGDYDWLWFYSNADRNSIITNLRMRHATAGILNYRATGFAHPVMNSQFIDCVTGIYGFVSAPDVMNCLFLRCDYGIRYTPSFDATGFDSLGIQGNTFIECESAIECNTYDIWPAGQFDLVLEDNLFSRNELAVDLVYTAGQGNTPPVYVVDRDNAWYSNGENAIRSGYQAVTCPVVPADTDRGNIIGNPLLAHLTSTITRTDGRFWHMRWESPDLVNIDDPLFHIGDGAFLAQSAGAASRWPFMVPDGVSITDIEIGDADEISEIDFLTIIAGIAGPSEAPSNSSATSSYARERVIVFGDDYNFAGSQTGPGRLWLMIGDPEFIENSWDLDGNTTLVLTLSDGENEETLTVHLPASEITGDGGDVLPLWVSSDGSTYWANASHAQVAIPNRALNQCSGYAMAVDDEGLAACAYDGRYAASGSDWEVARSPLVDTGSPDLWNTGFTSAATSDGETPNDGLDISFTFGDNNSGYEPDPAEDNPEDLLDIGYHYIVENQAPVGISLPYVPPLHPEKVFSTCSVTISNDPPPTGGEDPPPRPESRTVELDVDSHRQMDLASGYWDDDGRDGNGRLDANPTGIAVFPTRLYAYEWENTVEGETLDSVSLMMGRIDDTGDVARYIADFPGGTLVPTNRGEGAETIYMNTENSISAVAATAIADYDEDQNHAGTVYAACAVSRTRIPYPQNQDEGTFDEIEVYRLDPSRTGGAHHLVGYLWQETGEVSDDMSISDISLAANNTDLYVFWIERGSGSSGYGTLQGARIAGAWNIDNEAAWQNGAPSYDHDSPAVDLRTAMGTVRSNVTFATLAPELLAATLDTDWDFQEAAPRVIYVEDDQGYIAEQAHGALIRLTSGIPDGLEDDPEPLVTTGSDPDANGYSPAIAVNHTGISGTPRAHGVHQWRTWATGNQENDLHREELEVSPSEDWSFVENVTVHGPEPNTGYPDYPVDFKIANHPDIAHRFSGVARSVWAVETDRVFVDVAVPYENEPERGRDNWCVVASETGLVTYAPYSRSSAELVSHSLFPHIATSSNLTDLHAAWTSHLSGDTQVHINRLDP